MEGKDVPPRDNCLADAVEGTAERNIIVKAKRRWSV